MADKPWDLPVSREEPTSGGAPTPPATPGPVPAGGGAIRATDDDRSRTVDWLCWAAGSGQLSLEEVDSRVASAYAARTVEELRALTSDLQPRPVALEPTRGRAFRDRVRGRPPGLLPVLVLVLFVLFVATVAATHGGAAFPWLIVGGFFVARGHRHGPHGPHQHDRGGPPR
jgi:hypothetical protein